MTDYNNLNALQQDELAEADQIDKKEPFKVTDTGSADWVLRMLAALKAENENNNQLAQQNIDRIKKWRDKKNQETQQKREHFEFLLTDYFNQQRTKDPKFKLDTPNGRVSARKVPRKWKYDDENLVKSLKQADAKDFIRIKEEPDKKALKKAAYVTDAGDVVTEDGVKLDGVHVDPATYKTVIKVND